MRGMTLGAELEWPDVDVTKSLPSGWGWSSTDYSIINSSGFANDPRRELVREGGELNTPPVRSPEELAEAAGKLFASMRPGRNYRSNLHVHISIPQFAELRTVQRLSAVTREQLPVLLKVVDPLEGLFAGGSTTAAARRYRHSQRSRHFFVTDVRHDRRMAARTLEEMFAAEVPLSSTGRPAWALAPREAMNLRSLRKHGTVEFRCFADADGPEQLFAAASFVADWVRAALTGGDLAAVATRWVGQLPVQRPFSEHLERRWKTTTFKGRTRAEMERLLAKEGYESHGRLHR